MWQWSPRSVLLENLNFEPRSEIPIYRERKVQPSSLQCRGGLKPFCIIHLSASLFQHLFSFLLTQEIKFLTHINGQLPFPWVLWLSLIWPQYLSYVKPSLHCCGNKLSKTIINTSSIVIMMLTTDMIMLTSDHADHVHDDADDEDDYLWRRIAMDCAVNFHLNSSVSCGSPLLVHRHFGGSWKNDHFHVCIVMMIVDYDDHDGDDDDKTAIDIRHLATPRCCQRGLL